MRTFSRLYYVAALKDYRDATQIVNFVFYLFMTCQTVKICLIHGTFYSSIV